MASRAAIATAVVALSFAAAQAAAIAVLTFEGPLQASLPSGIGVLSYTLTAPTQTANPAIGAQSGQPGTLQITTDDTGSSKLLQAAGFGQHVSSMKLVAGGRTYTFRDVVIASYRSSASAASRVPVETITFSFPQMSDSSAPTLPTRVLPAAPVLPAAAQPTPTRTP
jgi:hypothetical protein